MYHLLQDVTSEVVFRKYKIFKDKFHAVVNTLKMCIHLQDRFKYFWVH